MNIHSARLSRDVEFAHRTKLKVPAHAHHRRDERLLKLPPPFARLGPLAQTAQSSFGGVALGAVAALNLGWRGHGSGGLARRYGGIGECGLIPKNDPFDIGAEVLASDDVATASFGFTLNGGASLGGDIPHPFAPLINGRGGDVEGARHFSLPPHSRTGSKNRRDVCAHVATVALLHNICKAMLNLLVDSIASMSKIWTTQEEAEKLAERFIGVNQAAFARDFAVPGGPSMLSQHIKGRRPMNMASALAYVRGFKVTLAEISPRLAQVQEALRALDGPHIREEPEPTQTELRPSRSEPRAPPPNFEDRKEVSPSDWGLLQDVKVVLSDEQIATIRRQAALLDERYRQVKRPWTAQGDQLLGGVNTNYGDLDDGEPQKKDKKRLGK